MALGELSSILPHDQGVVGILRKRLTQCCVEQILPRGIGDVIFSPNHMSYLHTGVINDNGVLYAYPPSLRFTMKSPITADEKLIGPWMRSMNDTSPVGTWKRSVACSPPCKRSSSSSAPCSSQRRSHMRMWPWANCSFFNPSNLSCPQMQ